MGEAFRHPLNPRTYVYTCIAITTINQLDCSAKMCLHVDEFSQFGTGTVDTAKLHKEIAVVDGLVDTPDVSTSGLAFLRGLSSTPEVAPPDYLYTPVAFAR